MSPTTRTPRRSSYGSIRRPPADPIAIAFGDSPMSRASTSLRLLAGAAALALLLAIPTLSRASDPAPTPPVLDARLRATLIDSLCANLMRNYVEADTARMIADFVRGRLKAGAYDTMTSTAHFSEVVTKDLRHINGDLHLSLRWDPMGAGPNGGPVIIRGTGPGGPGPQGIRRVIGGGENGAPGAGPAPGRPGGGPQVVRRVVGGGEPGHGGPGGTDAAPGQGGAVGPAGAP